MSAAPRIRGWCPGAYRPMMSGDGLVVRVRPRLSRISRDQALGLCDLAARFGNGAIDLTSRANLQIRGVTESDHLTLINALVALDLVDADPEAEHRRNIVVTPMAPAGDLTRALFDVLVEQLPGLPELPDKVGYAIDTGPAPVLSTVSADFRFETAPDGTAILRADGASSGMSVTAADAMQKLRRLIDWFCATGGPEAGRMSRHLKNTALPREFTGSLPAPAGRPMAPGAATDGQVYGATFGQTDADALRSLVVDSKATALRVTPWRLLVLENAEPVSGSDFIATPGDPLLRVHACPGAPRCSQAQVETRSIAKRLAHQLVPGTNLHVSGCAKGCAHPRAADITLVGNAARFDLVRKGAAWDEPARKSLSATETLKEMTG
ncbi:cobalamin biosynthesis protein CobG [uncultured Roseobacter sp.]|uniref:cobalamin biosynthesis protein CobG n=1 Tax=uncultured Roseobacter sp. TaxID=114847 RepID=UPI0026222DA3|nr:cobalamin biosynthesis protein CobG [uncultured Roseobacter sp.]